MKLLSSVSRILVFGIISVIILTTGLYAQQKERIFSEHRYVYTVPVPDERSNESNIIVEFGIDAVKSVASRIVVQLLGGGSRIFGAIGFISGLPSVGNSPHAEIYVIVDGEMVNQIFVYQEFLPIVYYNSGDYTNYNPNNIYIQIKKGFSWKTIETIRLFDDKYSLHLQDLIIPKNAVRIDEPGEYRVILDDWVSQRFQITIGSL